MKSRKLGNIEVSPVGMGCMGLSHGYGEIPPEEYSIAAIRKAYAFGCTFFDTAEAYGPNMLPENRGIMKGSWAGRCSRSAGRWCWPQSST